MNPLRIPPELPAYAREYLTQIDTAVTASLHAVPPDWSDDPRLYVAGSMWNWADNGTSKLMLDTYVRLIQEQSARSARAA